MADLLAMLLAWLERERKARMPFTEEWCRRRGAGFRAATLAKFGVRSEHCSHSGSKP